MERMQGHDVETHEATRQKGTSLWVRARRRGAEVLRTCAGVAAGWRGERRGTFLVLVVGVLALLSVIAIVYSAIGVGDRTRSFAVVKADRVNQVPDEVRDWIASIIAGDTFDTYYDQRPGNGETYRLRREATDYPYLDYNVVSSRVTAGYNPNADQPFTSSGGFEIGLDWNYWGTQPIKWAPSDPWLASTTPTWLHFTGTGTTSQRNGVLGNGESLADHERDWAKISNIAPDGRYVNLHNLRNNFEAPSGSGPNGLSTQLTLLQHTPSAAFSLANDTVTRPDFASTNLASPAYYDRPAYWSNRQVGLFRPVTSAGDAGDPKYFNYQYADADGDGFYDSRWQELVNASDPNNVFSVISKDTKYRWFVAARIVDLSSLVNVNTATDLVVPPSAEVPIGTSPAEVDLWRLLTQADLRDVYGQSLNGTTISPLTTPFGYDALPGARVSSATRPQEDSGIYTGFDPVQLGQQVGGHAYRSLRVGIAAGVIPPSSLITSNNGTTPPSPLAGELLMPWDYNASAVPGTYAEDLGLMAAAKLSQWKFDRYVGATRTNDVGDGAYARREFYGRRAAELGGGARLFDTTGNVSGYTSSLVFGMPDLAELLTRRGINDPEVRSSLELTLAGRWSNGATPIDSVRYSPMRDNRSLTMELAWDVNLRGQGDGLADLPPNGYPYRARAADVRQYLTTISGARLLASVDNVDSTRLDARDLKVDLLRELYNVASGANGAVNVQPGQPRPENVRAEATRKIFGAYADALAGYSDLPNAWDPTGGGGGVRTMFYGYNGPELATYFAAFSAINMQQLALQGSGLAPKQPYTLILSEAGRDFVENAGSAIFPEAFGYNTGGAVNRQVYGNRLDMDLLSVRATDAQRTYLPADQTRLAPGNATTATPVGAATIYPAEPQPFVTAVSCFTVYTDAPRSDGRGGDRDSADNSTNPPTVGRITIRPGVREENSDFLFRVVAFQITNPNATDIFLSSDETSIPSPGPGGQTYNMQFLDVTHTAYPPMDTEQEFHYLRFGNRTFKLVALSEGSGLADDVPDSIEGRRYFTDPEFNSRQSPPPGSQARPALRVSTAPHFGQELDTELVHAMVPQTHPTGMGINAMRIRVRAGETIVCYALSQPPADILRRMTYVELSGPNQLSQLEAISAKTLRTFFKSQFKGTGIDKVYWIPEIDGPRVQGVQTIVGTGDAGSYNEEPNGGASGTPAFQAWKTRSTPPAFGQLLRPHTGATTPDENKVVMLYKTRRYGLPSPNGGGPENIATSVTVPGVCWDNTPFGTASLLLYPRNDYSNDQLLDRFRLPVVGTDVQDLDSRLRSATWNEHKDLPSGFDGIREDTTTPDAAEGYDSGVTVMMGAWAMRPEDPSANAGGTVPAGVIPGYCLEPKNSAINGRNWNTYSTTFGAGGTFTTYPPFSQQNSTSQTVGLQPRSWLTQAGGGYQSGVRVGQPMGGGGAPFNADLATAPSSRAVNANGVDSKAQDDNLTGWARPSIKKMYAQINTLEYTGALPSVNESASGRLIRNLRKLRPTDAILPLAVGGIHAPNASGTPDLDNDWVTLGEMLAVTQGFDKQPVAGSLAGTLYDLFRPTPPDDVLYPTDTPPRPLTKGNLVLDDYAPFKMTGNGRGNNPVRFDRSQGDTRRGLQIPTALGILDRITFSGQGSLTEMVPGLVNANTMPQMVARTIPMLAPNTARAAAGSTVASGQLNGGFEPKGPDWAAHGASPLPNGAKKHYWWGQNGPNPQIPAAGAPASGGNYSTVDLPAEMDMTAAIFSYRDKGEAWLGLERVLRFNSTPTPQRPVPMPTNLTVLETATPPVLDRPIEDRDGRSASALIGGINELPGFRSLGEIMCARFRELGTNNRIDPLTIGYPYNIDFAGFDVVTPNTRTSDDVNNSFVGVDGAVRDANPSTANGGGNGWQPNKIGNEQSEKLMVAAGALGSLSVRSDVYAVWFVLHGYQRTDCERIGASDPLTPSIARRFMMVVDRSNVVKKGDTPKVLMFKEVPLN